MSFFFDYTMNNKINLQLKKRIVISQQFSIIPLRYKNKPIYIKSPKIIVPFGLNTNSDGSFSCHVSLTDADINPQIDNFLQFINRIEQFCQNAEICGTFRSSLKEYNGSQMLRVKFNQKITELFDENGELHNFDQINQLIVPQCQIILLLHIDNIWVNDQNPSEYGITWKLKQSRIYPPDKPFGGISLLGDTPAPSSSLPPSSPPLSPPPPPPPPPPPLLPQSPPIKWTPPKNPLCNCFSMITGGQFSLKKTVISTSGTKDSIQPQVTLAEILSIRNRLKSTQSNISGVNHI